MARAGPRCAFVRPVCSWGIAGLIGVAVPRSVIVCLDDRMPSVAGESLVRFPRLPAAVAAAQEKGECEDQQGENAAIYAEDDVECKQRIF